jgi:hypothetical protein
MPVNGLNDAIVAGLRELTDDEIAGCSAQTPAVGVASCGERLVPF